MTLMSVAFATSSSNLTGGFFVGEDVRLRLSVVNRYGVF